MEHSSPDSAFHISGKRVSRQHPDSGEEEQKNTDTNNSTSVKLPSKERKGEYTSRLRPRKIANYKDQFDISSSAQSYPESSDESNGIYTYGTCILPNSTSELRGIIERCEDEIKVLENKFLSEEQLDEGFFYYSHKDRENSNESISRQVYSNSDKRLNVRFFQSCGTA